MVKNHFVIAFRNISKNKVYTAVNILGLAIGIASFLLLIQYVIYERSYDIFIKDSDQIYRVTLDQYSNNEIGISSAENYPGVAPALKTDIPGIEAVARLYNMGYKNNVIISNEDTEGGLPVRLKQKRFMYADSALLPMLGYELVEGDVNTALAKPNMAAISESYAKLYFGSADPIGKMLRLKDDDNNDELCEITGVFEDVPENTHLKFDILFSYKTLYGRGDWAPRIFDGSWNQKGMYTYVKLFENSSRNEVESKLPDLIDKYSPDLAARNRKDVMLLQPIKDIHLYSNRADEAEVNGNAETVSAITLIALFILVIGWINYINLSTAKAVERANEVGVRKVMGAFKNQLVIQFLIESAIVSFLAIAIASIFIILAIPLFNSISGHSFTITHYLNSSLLGLMIALWLLSTLLSGAYPAFVLSSFDPASVLKGKLKSQRGGTFFRRSLVVLQFVTSVGLIAATIIVYNQVDFMRNQSIGMDIEQVMVIERPGIVPKDRKQVHSSTDVFRNELKKNGSVHNVTISTTVPGNKQEFKARVKRYGDNDDNIQVLNYNSMDHEFLDVFKMKLIAGRAFSPDHFNDRDTSIIITESASRLLGFKNVEDAIGENITIPIMGYDPVIVGVVNDYNQVSLKKNQNPTFFHCDLYDEGFYSIRIATNDIDRTIDHVRESWNKAFPGNPFEYFFLDEYFNRQYANDQQFGDFFATFSILAIFIGCLGLFGLSAYTAQQRTKEIGVRKVLGSSIAGIFILLSKEFVFLILIGIVIATPLTYYFMSQWLASFAYQNPIEWWVFVVSGLSVVIVALITVSFQTIKAATVNPIKSLRYE